MELASPINPGGDPDQHLSIFDLTVAELHEQVVRPAAFAAERLKALGSRTGPGSQMNEFCIHGLRNLLLDKEGWKIVQDDGVSRTVNLDRRIAIVPSAGNHLTGVEFGQGLTSKNPKGPAAFSHAKVVEAHGLETVESCHFDWKVKQAEEPKWDLWYLLHFRVDDEVRLELSAPSYLDGSRYPRGWMPRIILPPCPMVPVDPMAPTGPVAGVDDDDDGDIDVPVLSK